MDNLALNIFVPEERKPKPSKLQKPKKSPVRTVVKSSQVSNNVQKPLVGKKPVKTSQNGTVTSAKRFPKGKASSAKPFLVSEKFQKPQEPKEGFSVTFVKPKLFRKPELPTRSSDSGQEKSDAVEQQPNSTEPGLLNDVTEPGKTVEFSSSKTLSKDRVKRKTANADVFVAQTFSKWAINSPAGKVSVDFRGSASKKEVSVKRKHENGNEGGKRRKKDEGKIGDEIKERRENWTSSAQNEVRKSGPISSLFDGAPEVEKLDLDVEPVEERLFSSKQFSTVGVHPHLVGNLEQLFGITKMTVVQKKTIPVLMAGKDGLVRSQTGSGKTLAYAVPIMHKLSEMKPQLTRKDGVKALVVLPTRELALQTYECFTKLMRAFTWIVPGIVVGGEKRKSEKNRLRKGINVLIGTLGRLLDHAEHTENLSLHGIDWLIVDEADKLLEMGYEKDITALMSIIDKQRLNAENVGRKQTVLLSATLTSGVERLANLALSDPVRIDACGEVMEDVLVIPSTLQQQYVVVPAKMRLVALASYLVDVTELKNSNKILVFMATQDMVDFYLELLQGVLSTGVKFYKLHGNMSQTDRTEVFNRFRSSDKGVLLSTDVAARGLDLPKVDWIVQYTAPTTPAEYVHRVGRTARVGTTGSALLFLLPSELHFVSMLNSSRIKMGEASLDGYLKSLMKIHLESKDGQRWGGGVKGAATVLQHNFEHSVLEDSALHDLAAKAYKSWVRFYATYPKDLRVVFDFKSLHLGHNAKSFALRDPPRAIGGIGKPVKGDKRNGKIRKDDRRKRKSDGLGHVTSGSRTKKLIMSEFDSGLKPLKKS